MTTDLTPRAGSLHHAGTLHHAATRGRDGAPRDGVVVAVAGEPVTDPAGAGGPPPAPVSAVAPLLARLAGARVLSAHRGHVLLHVPGPVRSAERRLGRARAAVPAASPLVLGWAPVGPQGLPVAEARAEQALGVALARRDLVPARWTPAAGRGRARGAATRALRRLVAGPTAWQTVLSYVLVLLVPYLLYGAADRLGVVRPVLATVYLSTVVVLLVTALAIYAECARALGPVGPPARARGPAPAASCVVAAYLPNEAATIVETLRAVLALHHPAGLQVVLAYNTPEPLPVEAELAALAAADPRLLLLRVPGSTSKAQNVNAALGVVTGEVVGIFDADHHPATDCLERAWRWISHGYGVVQGHCVVRNGTDSFVARTTAVEFVGIYGVAHPGRAALHGFGIFGGSNGFWRTDLLREVRLRGGVLTEDIDSSLRVVLRGERVASDPGLCSRELAPTTLRALVRQRLRWSQGWFQVSRRYSATALRSPRLTPRQKAGTVALLAWRELYPWASVQVLPVLAYTLAHPGVGPHSWVVPLFLLTSAVTLGVGPVQTAVAWQVAPPELRARWRWFLVHGLLVSPVHAELKNAVARVAQLKDLTGERAWRVTAR